MRRLPILASALLLAASIACEGTPTDTATDLGADQAMVAAQRGPPAGVGPPDGRGPPEGEGPPEGKGPAFFSRIAFASDRDGDFDVFVMDGNGSNPVRLTADVAAENDIDPAWSPDGTQIAFASTRLFKGSDRHTVWVMNADGSEPTFLDRTGSAICFPSIVAGPAWSPDGTKIAYNAGCDGWFELFWVDAEGERSHLLTRLGGLNADPAWSPDGSTIAFTTDHRGHEEIWVVDPIDRSSRFLGPIAPTCSVENPRAREPTWSPDGARIAFALECHGNFDIYLMDIDGSNLVRVTDDPGNDFEPAWSSDGRVIAFVSDRSDGDTDIWVMNADGSFQTNLTEESTASERSPSWEP